MDMMRRSSCSSLLMTHSLSHSWYSKFCFCVRSRKYMRYRCTNMREEIRCNAQSAPIWSISLSRMAIIDSIIHTHSRIYPESRRICDLPYRILIDFCYLSISFFCSSGFSLDRYKKKTILISAKDSYLSPHTYII
jgi:hypothetical protein